MGRRIEAGRSLARVAVVATQWVLLSAALSAVTIYSSTSITGMVTPYIDGSWVLIGAFVTALLLGITIESLKVLISATVLMWIIAAAMLCALILAPTWDGSVVRTEAMENFAINQLVILPLLMALPGGIGAICGHLLRRLLGQSQVILPLPHQQSPDDLDTPRRAWWDERER